VPRTRPSNARLAVLGSSVERPASAPYSPRSRSPLTRRVVMGVLVLLALALITISFRESSGGPLHAVQGAGATVLRPFEVGVERVARPFRDAYGWFHDLTVAKSENERLREQLVRYRNLYIQSASAREQNAQLKALLRYVDTPTFPDDYRAVNTRVLAQPGGQFSQQIVIAAGANQGVALHDPVVTADGLVGDVTRVFSRSALATLLTDEELAVAAMDVTGATGLIRHGPSTGNTLMLDRVTKDQVVRRGDMIVTAGTLAGDLRSIYPKNIPIGTVQSASQTDIGSYKDIQVKPFVHFGSLQSVAVLVPKDRGRKAP
jgi:rod shape-determining protein MreC